MIKFIERYNVNEDERGRFEGLINFGSWEEFNLVSIVKGKTRGGHYHKYTHEAFIMLEGMVSVELENAQAPLKQSVTVKKGDVFIISPNVFHTFSALENSSWINVLSKKHDRNDPDFHK